MRTVSSLRGIYLGLSIAVAATTHLAEGDTRDQMVVSGENGLEIRLLNMRPESVDTSALKIACRKIVDLAAADKLVPAKVLIFAEHPIVGEALADRTIQISARINDGPATFLVPLSHKGNRIILKTKFQNKDSYALHSLPDDSGVDLRALLTPRGG